MSMPKPARPRGAIRTLAAAGGMMLLAACADTGTAPSPRTTSRTTERPSDFVPTAAQRQLYGIYDGTYVVTFNPAYSQSFGIGGNRLDIPANAVCALATSGYGSSYWNQSCTPETQSITLTVKVSGALTNHPLVDFQPAMRFNPTKQVMLYMYVPGATQQDARNWVMTYCGTGSSLCVDESKTDPDLTSYVDRSANVVFRRVKHFSGYLVWSDQDSTPPPP